MNGLASCFPVFSMFFPLWAAPLPHCDISVPYWLLLDLQHPLSLACLAQGIFTPLSPLVIDPPVSLFTFTMKYKIRGFGVNRGTKAEFQLRIVLVALWFLSTRVHYFPVKHLIYVHSVSTQQFFFLQKLSIFSHFNNEKYLVGLLFSITWKKSLSSVAFWKACLLLQPGDQY